MSELSLFLAWVIYEIIYHVLKSPISHPLVFMLSQWDIMMGLLTGAFQHDAVLDYYGRRLATCSSDRTIHIFEIEGESQRLTETLRG